MHFGSSMEGAQAKDNNRYIQITQPTHCSMQRLRARLGSNQINLPAGWIIKRERGRDSELIVIVVVLFFGVVWLIAIEATSTKGEGEPSEEEGDGQDLRSRIFSF